MPELAIRGGTPVRTEPYPVWPQLDERDIAAVTEVLREGQLGGFPEPGPRAARFAAGFASYQGAAHGIVMANGTITMEVALKALGIGWGDEVIIPALTFSATPYAAIAAGALPVFVDVEPERWTIDPDLVEAAITPATRAIMPVHLGQQMADMDRIMAIADRHGLAVVEDCAHAHGQRFGDTGAGCFGAFGSFSHQTTKIMPAGEGGTLLTQDEALARRAHSLIDCGRPKDAAEQEYTFGANYRLGRAQRRPALRRAGALRGAAGGAGAACPAVRDAGRRPHRRRAQPDPSPGHPVGLLPLPVPDRPGAVRGRVELGDRGRAGGRGDRGRGAVPADEPLRPVPAPALADARVRRSTPTASTSRR